MNAQAAAIARTSATAHDAFLVLGPKIHALRPRVALNHPLGIITGLVGKRFDRDQITGIYLDLRFQHLAEIPPVHGLGIRGQMIITLLPGLPGSRGLRKGGRDQ